MKIFVCNIWNWQLPFGFSGVEVISWVLKVILGVVEVISGVVEVISGVVETKSVIKFKFYRLKYVSIFPADSL